MTKQDNRAPYGVEHRQPLDYEHREPRPALSRVLALLAIAFGVLVLVGLVTDARAGETLEETMERLATELAETHDELQRAQVVAPGPSLDPTRPSDAPHTVAVPGVTGPELTEEALAQVILCGAPIVAVEVTAEGKAYLWIGRPLFDRIVAATIEREVMNYTSLERHYPGLRILCGPEREPTTPKRPARSAAREIPLPRLGM